MATLMARDVGYRHDDLGPLLPEAPVRVPLPPAVRAIDAPPPEPITWLIEDLWTKGDIGLIVGDGGAFKSSAALHMAAAVAGGYPVFGKFRAIQRPVLIVSAEDSASVILMRLEAFVVGQGWDRTRVLSNIHFFAQDDASLTELRWQLHLLAEVKRLDAGFVILDPMAELIDGDENSNSDVRPVIKFVRALSAATGASVAVVHHAGKAGPDKRTLDRIRGASALASAARVILFFEFKPEGVRVENLKMSRAERLETFILEREIEHEMGNRAMWTSARLTHGNAKQLQRERADTFVLTQLRNSHPTRPTTTRLREVAREFSGIRNEELQKALNRLFDLGLIDKEAGPRTTIYWGITEAGRADLLGALRVLGTLGTLKNEAAHPAPGPGHPQNEPPREGAHPFRGGAPSTAQRNGLGTLNSEIELELEDDRGEAWEEE